MKSKGVLLKSLWLHSFLVALFWQAVTAGLGTLLAISENRTSADGFMLFGDSFKPNWPPILDHMVRFDSEWYILIATHGYSALPDTAAFYPLYPTLLAIGYHLVGIQLLPLFGLLLNTAALTVVIHNLVKIGTRWGLKTSASWLMIFVWLFSPAAYSLDLLYSEAVFIALATSAYLAALRGRWPLVGVLLMALTFCRLPGILIVLLCGLEWLRQNGWFSKRVFRKEVLWFLLAPLGFLGYMGICLFVWGNPLAMKDNVYQSIYWHYQEFNPRFWETFAKAFDQALYEDNFHSLMGLISILVMLISFGALWLQKKSMAFPIIVTGLLFVLLISINSTFLSSFRYLFSFFPLVFIFGYLANRYRFGWIAGVLAIGFMAPVFFRVIALASSNIGLLPL